MLAANQVVIKITMRVFLEISINSGILSVIPAISYPKIGCHCQYWPDWRVKIERGMKSQNRVEVFSPFTPADCASRRPAATDGGALVSLFGLSLAPLLLCDSQSSY
jgi:hypothetical protein